MKTLDLKIFGESLSHARPLGEVKDLKVDLRPGGWVIVTYKDASGHAHRRRLSLWEKGQKFTYHVQSSDGSTRIGFGDKVIATRGGDSSQAGAGNLTTQFPSKVRKVKVKDGDTVVKGAPLVVLEAMKMEFVIEAPSDGIVKKVRVSEGQTLDPGVQLLDWEAAKATNVKKGAS